MMNAGSSKEADEPGDEEAKELLEAALETGIVSTACQNCTEAKHPGRLLRQADGLDIIKKASTRKGRCLMLFTCQLALVPGGVLGELQCMDSQTPVLYMTVPAGRLKFEGTFAHPKNKYMVLKLGSRKNIQFEHAFEHIVLFSKVSWVGKHEDNPSERPLPIPEELKKLPEDHGYCEPVFGQGLGAAGVSARGSGSGASPSKPQRAQPGRKSRAKAVKLVETDESESALVLDSDDDDADERAAEGQSAGEDYDASEGGEEEYTAPSVKKGNGKRRASAEGKQQSKQKRPDEKSTKKKRGAVSESVPTPVKRESASTPVKQQPASTPVKLKRAAGDCDEEMVSETPQRRTPSSRMQAKKPLYLDGDEEDEEEDEKGGDAEEDGPGSEEDDDDSDYAESD